MFQIYEISTDSINNKFLITSHKIKVDGNDPSISVFFVNKANNLSIPVTEPLAVDEASNIVGIIPNLSAGEYAVEIVIQYAHGTQVTISYPKSSTLTVK